MLREEDILHVDNMRVADLAHDGDLVLDVALLIVFHLARWDEDDGRIS